MAPLPLRADGVTPSTSIQPTRTQPTTTTSNAAIQQTPLAPAQPAAQPGKAAFPGPTAPAQAPVSTKTQNDQNEKVGNGPPAPEPGAVPVPPAPTSAVTSPAAPMPAGGVLSNTVSETHATKMPDQIKIPSPTTSSLQTHSTSTSNTMTPIKGGTTLDLGPISPIGRPAGYVQNPHASEMTSSQRHTLEASERNEARSGSLSGILPTALADGLDSISRAMNGSSTANLDGNVDEKGVWGTVKDLASSAGAKVMEAEEEVWKRLNGKS